tara:strand:- start:2192 stop:2359 length:168 start_codon:yes stop_codon:yes gene_type:complete
MRVFFVLWSFPKCGWAHLLKRQSIAERNTAFFRKDGLLPMQKAKRGAWLIQQQLY